MNKKLLSVVMSGAMVASACSTGVSAASTGFKDSVKGSVVNAANFVKNHKPTFIGGAVAGTAVIGGSIVWLVYHNRDIKLDCNDKDFGTRLPLALKAFKNSLTITNVEKSKINEINEGLKGSLEAINVELNKSAEGKKDVKKVEWKVVEFKADDELADDTKGIIVFNKTVKDGNVELKGEFKKVEEKKVEEKEKEEEKKAEEKEEVAEDTQAEDTQEEINGEGQKKN